MTSALPADSRSALSDGLTAAIRLREARPGTPLFIGVCVPTFVQMRQEAARAEAAQRRTQAAVWREAERARAAYLRVSSAALLRRGAAVKATAKPAVTMPAAFASVPATDSYRAMMTDQRRWR
jgi:hypothetical protein